MKSIVLYISFLLLFFTQKLYAQSGSCGPEGIYVNYEDYVNYDRSTGGDAEVDTAGNLEIGPSGNYDIYGAVLNKGIIQVDSGGVLSIYGDVVNNAIFKLHKNGTVHFYGNTWKNGPGSIMSDGDSLINTTPGGSLNFTASRPNVPSDWITLSACLSSYSGGNAIQFADGGNVPMDVELHLKNANNVVLVNTPMRIEGKLLWDVANGDIVLGNQDLIMTQNATQDGFQPDRFAITSGTGHLVKENYIGNWIFPVGIADGDYTPAAIDNVGANTMHVLVQDYATSTSDEALSGPTADGMQRTWNIYADIASGTANVNLQHNDITNQPFFNDAFNFVTRWGTVVPNPTGDYTVAFGMSAWQTNFGAAGSTGNLSSTGTVAGSNMRSRSYTGFATIASDHIAFFSKSSDPSHPLPVQLISFTAQSNNSCEVLVNFKTGVENSISKYQVQRSTDGKTFNTITTVDPKGSNSDYSFVDKVPVNGNNFYRLVMIEPNGDYTRSPVVSVNVDCDIKKPDIKLYPNPAIDFITISGMQSASQIRITNIHGRVVFALSSFAISEIIDVSQLAAATYMVQVISNKTEITNLKFVKL